MPDRRLAAVMVTDMVGFTALMDADEERALNLLSRGQEILRSIVEKHQGEWLEDAGDRTLTAFPSAINAVECALEIQTKLKEEPEPKFRIGVNVGEILLSRGHVYGDAVNIASFIERLADPDGLIITEPVYHAVRNHIDLKVIDLGEKVIKNIGHGIRLYALTGARAGSPVSNFFSGLMARRVPHIAGAYLAASWAVIEVTEWLSNNGILDYRWVYGASVGLIALLPSVLLVVWSHGAHGRERLTSTEKFAVPLNLVIAALLVAFVYQRAEIPERTTPIAKASVAVLPFVNLGPNSDDYFGLGLSEEVINALAKVPEMYVASRTSSFAFDSPDDDPRDIAQKLRVATILEGSVRKEGDNVRVTAQLIDGRNNYHLWSETFDRKLTDIIHIQESVAQAVSAELVGVLQPEVTSAIREAQAATLEAYDYYSQGLSYLRQTPTRQSLDHAQDLLERSLKEDPRYASAHAALCEVALERFELDRAAARIDEAKVECFKALRLDESLRDVKVALGELYRHTGDYEESANIFRELLDRQPSARAWIGIGETRAAQGEEEAAERAFESAIMLEPGNWRNHMAFAEYLYWQGRFEKTIEALGRVLELSPDNARAYLLIAASHDYLGDTDASIRANLKSIELEPTRAGYRDLGLTYYYSGDYEKALSAFERAVDLGRDDHAAWGNLAMTYRQLGAKEEATAAFERATLLATDLIERNPRDWLTMARLAVYNVMVGDTAAGLQRIRTAASEGSHVPDVHYFDAVIHATLGQSEQALDALERAIDRGTPVRMISTDPEFDSLKNSDRYRALVATQMEIKND